MVFKASNRPINFWRTVEGSSRQVQEGAHARTSLASGQTGAPSLITGHCLLPGLGTVSQAVATSCSLLITISMETRT